MRRAFLGIDLGTGSVKALIVDAEDGRSLGEASAPYPTERPEPNAAEQSPELWWRATQDAVRRAISIAGNPPVAAIGLSGQMHGTVTLDAGGRSTGNAIIWSDGRSAPDAAAINEAFGERLLHLAGSRVAPGFQAATIRRLRRTDPDRRRATATFLLPKDYLRFRLTGELATEPSDAASTLLFDNRARDWSPELLDAAGVERARLPRILPSAGVSGRLTRSAALALGLKPETPVAGGAADAPAAALGAGVIEPGTLLLTMSTGGQILTPLAEARVDAAGRLHTFAAPFEPGGVGAPWYCMGATLNTGLALRWLRDDLFGLSGPGAYETMTGQAARAPIGAGGLLFLPYLTGERTPHLNPNARGALIGLDASHDRGHLTRAVMEGVALALHDAWSVLREVTEATPERIVLAGGGGRSALWRQIVADLFGLPVRPLRQSEQSALGAAILAAASTGLDPGELAHRWIRYDRDVAPDPAAHDRYRELVPLFQDAYRAQLELFEQLARWRLSD